MSRVRRHAQRASISTSTTSTLTIYHTRSSSFFGDADGEGASEYWHSARSCLRESVAPLLADQSLAVSRPPQHNPDAEAATTPAHLGPGFPSTPRRNGVDSNSVLEATNTRVGFSSSASLSSQSSQDLLSSSGPSTSGCESEFAAALPSPPSATKSSPTWRIPNGAGKPLSPALNTPSPLSFTTALKEQATPKDGPSSNALSAPLPATLSREGARSVRFLRRFSLHIYFLCRRRDDDDIEPGVRAPRQNRYLPAPRCRVRAQGVQWKALYKRGMV
ncbi:hypothetical protein MSAN_00244700 [Mycena sanguinolenta]|uniref:Uncharacterized protein n=1 Tax=Mycena sanguinolenta TaxID=230812 RepID=A0A8H6ZKR3_9AGAR|nr:hypothetical protein MSAN_00244700 [Mycena sanguinolenta]